MENHETAADEARQIHEEQRERVLVSCSLPNGIVLNNHLDAKGNPTAAANMGPGTPIEVRGSGQPVDKAFYDAWAAHNPDIVARGLVSATPFAEIQQNEAIERDGEENMGRESPRDAEQDLDEAREAKDA